MVECIADFIRNGFVIISSAAFFAYVWSRGLAVCWHKFVKAGILGKDQRHRILLIWQKVPKPMMCSNL